MERCYLQSFQVVVRNQFKPWHEWPISIIRWQVCRGWYRGQCPSPEVSFGKQNLGFQVWNPFDLVTPLPGQFTCGLTSFHTWNSNNIIIITTKTWYSIPSKISSRHFTSYIHKANMYNSTTKIHKNTLHNNHTYTMHKCWLQHNHTYKKHKCWLQQ